jgi:serine/threonine protein kinase
MTELVPSTPNSDVSVKRREAISANLSSLSQCGDEARARIGDLQSQTASLLDKLEKAGEDDAAAALEELIGSLVRKLREWSAHHVAQVLFLVDGHLKQDPPSLRYIADNIEEWLTAHVDEPDKFSHCLKISPPSGIVIERVLNAGAQKQVFVARWPEVSPHKVAFKQFHDSDGSGSGDSFPHPLRGHHPNIIETFPLNNQGEGGNVYLVERLLSTTLSYGWDFPGLGEIVNLVRDIAHALSFVHGFNRIHGDVKLENIGFEDFYILLDFGLCRSEPSNSTAWTPTGNVRGLAPEQLHGKANTKKSDVWALGSVAFAALTGRPPYFRSDEKQAGFSSQERERTLARLSERADDTQWQRENDRRLTAAVPELALQQMLREMLEPDPELRPTAKQVFEVCNDRLAHFLRPVQTTVQPRTHKRFTELLYLQEIGDLSLASSGQLAATRAIAERIDPSELDPVEQATFKALLTSIDSP